jgi:hypothetical protein
MAHEGEVHRMGPGIVIDLIKGGGGRAASIGEQQVNPPKADTVWLDQLFWEFQERSHHRGKAALPHQSRPTPSRPPPAFPDPGC